MVSLHASVDQETSARIVSSIAAYMDYMRKTPLQAVTYAGLKIAESGRSIAAKSASARGKGLRDVVPNPSYREQALAWRWARARKKKGLPISPEAEAALGQLQDAPYLIVYRRQRGDASMVPSYDGTGDPRRRILTVDQRTATGKPGKGGLARRTWNIIAGRMGAAGGGADASGSGQYVFVGTRHIVGEVQLRVINRLTYLEKAFPGITAKAMQKGSLALENRIHARIDAAKKASRLN